MVLTTDPCVLIVRIAKLYRDLWGKLKINLYVGLIEKIKIK